MKVSVEYDNESDGETVELTGDDVMLLDVRPVEIENGSIAHYEFPSDVEEDDLEEALDQSDWCFKGYAIDTGSPKP